MFAHCFTCIKDVLAASTIAQALTGLGIAVLRFDFTGLGGSGGNFANTNFTSNVADLVNAADYLRSTHTAPTILVGHSLGGADHLLTRVADARFAASMQASWASRYLDEGAAQAPDSSDSSAVSGIKEGLVVVSENGEGPYGQRITAGRHLLNADE